MDIENKTELVAVEEVKTEDIAVVTPEEKPAEEPTVELQAEAPCAEEVIVVAPVEPKAEEAPVMEEVKTEVPSEVEELKSKIAELELKLSQSMAIQHSMKDKMGEAPMKFALKSTAPQHKFWHQYVAQVKKEHKHMTDVQAFNHAKTLYPEVYAHFRGNASN